MATRTFSDMVNRLAPSVPGCPAPVITTFIRDAAIEVCERTLAWRYVQDLIRLTPGVFDYDFEVPDDAEAHAILTASMNGVPISAVPLEKVQATQPSFPSEDSEERGPPQLLVHIDPSTFYTVPAPDDVRTYDVRMIVALKPTRTATGMDSAAMNDLETVIMHCALQHILVLPEKTWSDRELAAYHAKQYAFKAAERRARANVGSGRAVLTVAMRPLA